MTYFIVFDDRYGLESIIRYVIEYRFSIIMTIEKLYDAIFDRLSNTRIR